MNDKKKGCLQLVTAFTLFFIVLNLLGVTNISWFALTWFIWVPILLILIIAIMV